MAQDVIYLVVIPPYLLIYLLKVVRLIQLQQNISVKTSQQILNVSQILKDINAFGMTIYVWIRYVLMHQKNSQLIYNANRFIVIVLQ